MNTIIQTTLMSALICIFVVNQLMIASVSQAAGTQHGMGDFFRPQTAQAMEIMMPVPDEMGQTTHLQMMPTITPIPSEPNTGNTVADATTVMIAQGTPFYAPEGVSFDDPVGSLDIWGKYESLPLPDNLVERFRKLISTLPCNFCCGSPQDVTLNANCGCAHAAAARGFFKYMLVSYADRYSDEELYGEAYRWQAIWYPSGVVEDYLLGTGRGHIMGHTSHGGAGMNGMHGIE